MVKLIVPTKADRKAAAWHLYHYESFAYDALDVVEEARMIAARRAGVEASR